MPAPHQRMKAEKERASAAFFILLPSTFILCLPGSDTQVACRSRRAPPIPSCSARPASVQIAFRAAFPSPFVAWRLRRVRRAASSTARCANAIFCTSFIACRCMPVRKLRCASQKIHIQPANQVILPHIIVAGLQRFLHIAEASSGSPPAAPVSVQARCFCLLDMLPLPQNALEFEIEFRHGRLSEYWNKTLGFTAQPLPLAGAGFALCALISFLKLIDPRQPARTAPSGLIEVRWSRRILLQILQDPRPRLHGQIKFRIHARHIRADVHQIFDVLIRRQQRQHPPCRCDVIACRTTSPAHSADALDHVDRREMPAIGQRRLSQRCPSVMPLTASGIGSLKSSPSTSTV